MSQAKRSSSFFRFALIFAVVYLGSQLLLRTFFPQQQSGTNVPSVEISAKNVRSGGDPSITVTNRTQTGIVLPARCPLPPVDVTLIAKAGQPEERTPLTPMGGADDAKLLENASKTSIPCEPSPVVPAGESAQINLAPWKYSVFKEYGLYEVRLQLDSKTTAELKKTTGSGTALGQGLVTTQFSVTEPGFFTKIFRTFITKPFLNFLILIASLAPGYNLGIAIIVLTVVVKLLLFFPTQHALEGQKKMQMLQPKLEELKKRYPNDPKKQQEETMKLWKEHKVNPMQACLPTLVQFPILIGLFYVVRDGSNLELSRHLIYPFYQHLSWTFGTNFLGLNLLLPNFYILPPLLAILQYAQMKLTFAMNDRKKAKDQKVIDVGKAAKEPVSATQMQQKIMLYGLPIMIGAFAFQFPAAVSIYWGVSTVFAIIQQMIVNREHLSVR